MASNAQVWSTSIARVLPDDVLVRGTLLSDLVGARTFTEVVFLEIVGRFPDMDEIRMLDAVLVSLVEHGISPSSMITRMLVSCGTPVQAALAGGLLSIADWHGGSGEQLGVLLVRMVKALAGDPSSEEFDAVATAAVEDYAVAGRRFDGFGHPQHPEGDPRAEKLMAMAEAGGVAGPHSRAARALAAAIRTHHGRPLPLNVTGAIAAILLDLGFPVRAIRGVGIGARAFGLTAHVVEELDQGGRWRHVDADDVEYTGPVTAVTSERPE